MIETENLIVRNYQEEDFFDFWEIFSDNRVTKNYGFHAFKRTKDAWEFFSARLKAPLDFAIELKPKSKVVGEICLSMPCYYCPYEDSASSKEIAVIMNHEFLGKGIMTEAERAMIKHSFEVFKFNSIFARIFHKNFASLKLAKKCGMKELSTQEEMISYSSKKIITTMGITRKECETSPVYNEVEYLVKEDELKKSSNFLTKSVIIDKIEQKIKMEEQKEFQEVAELFGLQREVGC